MRLVTFKSAGRERVGALLVPTTGRKERVVDLNAAAKAMRRRTGTASRMEAIDDMLARMPDYLERFQTFYAHRPHPAVVNVPGVEAWTKLPAFVVKFTDLRHHVSEHERFAQTVRRFKQQFDDSPDRLNTDSLLNTLKNWITGHIRHILKSDREMIPYLRGEK